MADPKYTAYSSAISGIMMEGHKDYPDLVTVHVTFADGVTKKVWDTTTHRDMKWMEKVQMDTGLQRLHLCKPSRHLYLSDQHLAY